MALLENAGSQDRTQATQVKINFEMHRKKKDWSCPIHVDVSFLYKLTSNLLWIQIH